MERSFLKPREEVTRQPVGQAQHVQFSSLPLIPSAAERWKALEPKSRLKHSSEACSSHYNQEYQFSEFMSLSYSTLLKNHPFLVKIASSCDCILTCSCNPERYAAVTNCYSSLQKSMCMAST
jgi:hypothetical protein